MIDHARTNDLVPRFLGKLRCNRGDAHIVEVGQNYSLIAIRVRSCRRASLTLEQHPLTLPLLDLEDPLMDFIILVSEQYQ